MLLNLANLSIAQLITALQVRYPTDTITTANYFGRNVDGDFVYHTTFWNANEGKPERGKLYVFVAKDGNVVADY